MAPFKYAWFALPMVFILPAALAGGLGYLVFRSRITGVYFALITQALALIVSILFIGQQPYTGGTNGITNYSTLFGFQVFSPSTQVALYFVTVGVLVIIYLLLKLVVESRFGRVMVAMRDDENRVRFIGYDPAIMKALIFAVSGGIAGIAGALFVPQVGIISPSSMGIMQSIEVAVWVAVGGPGNVGRSGDRGGAGERGQERVERVIPGHLAVLSWGVVHQRGAAIPGGHHGGYPG